MTAGRLRGRLEGGGERGVLISGDEQTLRTLYEEGYGGRPEGGAARLSLLEAAYLVGRGELEVEGIGDQAAALELLASKRPDDFLKFVVYSDLRRRERIVRHEERTPFLRLYPRGSMRGESAARELVVPLSEDEPVMHGDLLDLVAYAGRLRKKLVFAIVDDELDVTYYRAESFLPMGVARVRAGLPKCSGRLIHDKVVIWDGPSGGSLYRADFWGHPMGVEKPKPGLLYEVPLVLSLFEAIYLVSLGVLSVENVGGKPCDRNLLLERVEELRVGGRVKAKVFSFWRSKGYVVKPASKYGVDFMLYEKGPGLDHAPYLVMASAPGWKILPVELLRAGRVATSVRKDLVVSVAGEGRIRNYKLEWIKP